MSRFSIKDIESVTGIKGHTLRMWEQRFGIIIPKRTQTNIRYYDDGDLKELLNIGILNKHGYKISLIAKMSKEERNEAILQLSTRENEFGIQIKTLVSAMLDFDEARFHKVLSSNIKQYGLEQSMLKIIFPFLNEVGVLWQVGSILPSHEHFSSNIIRQKLYTAIEEHTGHTHENARCFALFLPEGEQHTIGLLFANYLIRIRGHEVLYLGRELPLEDLKLIFSNKKINYFFITLTSGNAKVNLQELVNYLSSQWPDRHTFLAGAQVLRAGISLPVNASIIRNIEDLPEVLDHLSPNAIRIVA